jgi:hypothetical protein
MIKIGYKCLDSIYLATGFWFRGFTDFILYLITYIIDYHFGPFNEYLSNYKINEYILMSNKQALYRILRIVCVIYSIFMFWYDIYYHLLIS